MSGEVAAGETEGEEEVNSWTESLERDIEVTESQLAIASLLPKTTTRFVHVEAERLQRLVEAARSTISDDLQVSQKAKYSQKILDDLFDDGIIGALQYEDLRRMIVDE